MTYYLYIMIGPFVINLAHRTDRLSHIESEFSRLSIPFHRIEAIYNENDGASGCLESHIKILESTHDLNQPVWICEDDCKFLVDRETLDKYINAFLESDAEILCLGYNDRKSSDYNTLFLRSTDCQTTSSYIIKPSLQKVLLDLWKTTVSCRKDHTTHPLEHLYWKLPVFRCGFYFADQSWKLLQQSHTFLIPRTRLVIQTESYSDIEKRMTNYKC